MSAGERRVRATFWLLEAPDSLVSQSHHNPDGTGLGVYDDDRRPVIHKAPIAAYEDPEFAHQARAAQSPTFVAHVRFASTGGHTVQNTHPFEQNGRLFAHNGVLEDLPRLEEHLGSARSLVRGESDSERLFALITRETEARDGDLRAGIVSAVSWAAENLPVYALNLVLITDRELFALRYPATHSLYVLERAPGGQSGEEVLSHRSSLGSQVHSEQAAGRALVVTASERLDDDPGWRELAPGELLHVSPALEASSEVALPRAPAHQLSLEELDEQVRASQRPTG
jgi:predicted glutamine amidotransferase